MSKFGQLIDEKIPLLLVFYDLNSIEDNFMDLSPILKDVAAALGDKGKVIKIDINKINSWYMAKCQNPPTAPGPPKIALFISKLAVDS